MQYIVFVTSQARDRRPPWNRLCPHLASAFISDFRSPVAMIRTGALARLPVARKAFPLHRPLSTVARSSNARPLILLASVVVMGATGVGLAWSPLQAESSKDHQGYDRQSQLHKGKIGELKPSVFACVSLSIL